jgi:outer membrane protein assembly factor BamB
MERIVRNVAFSIVLMVFFSLLLFSTASSTEDNTKAMQVHVSAMPLPKQAPIFDEIRDIQNINPTQSASLENDLVLDFSQTQLDFIEPMDAGPGIFKFKGTNTGTKDILVFFDWSCKSEGVQVEKPVGAPQGATPLAPGESMWFKILPEGCGYDANISQTITRTLSMSFTDNNNNWSNQEDNSFAVEKTIQIKVIGDNTLAGDVTIQGVTVDEEGNPVPYVEIDLGGYRWKTVIQSDATGNFSYSIAESPAYFLIAQKEGYRTADIEIDGDNIQDFYTVTLAVEASPISVSASLINSVTGNIGFYRCAATADESKLLLVNGMENWEDESLKDESKLYLLDTNTGEVLWTHDMGWGSWSADITDDGQYAVFGTKLEGFQTGPEGFVNYIRLLNGTNGVTIWQKNITTENFPTTTTGEFYTRGVKFSHSGEYLFVPVPYEDGYLLNRSDGSIKWHKWVGQNIREVLFTQDDQYVYIPSGSGWLYKFKVEDGSQVWKQWIGCWAFVNGFDLSRDEAYIAVGSKAAYLTVINTSDGSVRFTKDFHGGSATCRFSPSGTRLIVGGAHSFTMMLDLDGNVLWRYYAIGCDIRWSGDSRLIFSNSGNVFDTYGTRLYDISPSGVINTQVGWLNSHATRFIQDALANVKRLTGMLPICASCKKIRDDKGYWSQVESYVSEHTEAVFSHSICPECAKKLYPEFDLYPETK